MDNQYLTDPSYWLVDVSDGNNSHPLATLVIDAMIVQSEFAKFIAKDYMKNKRTRKPKSEVPLEELEFRGMGVAGNVNSAQQPHRRVVAIERNLLRTVTECHYSDGTITKEDRTYPVPTTQTIFE